mmetsp:Transcript_23418/g.41426  ORF Transcript_23418/g.41426 Transcript_23418/m.41426 type:complete len:165 (-) Transcript_23418:121-615(-)|eukprot:CAMPEP_0197525078 /NCGR_PEP_ID=MMETSP1318-20131121/10606_1 /TAXON_ID=552666 /ORGANISM="Partenskyella glossopodia, Strain RCC365" /LENGTH=164 /DNA_ID=CAMNT_0043078239 /DNA_START=6 /DNA_END=500 /DNA_ORIENTATION=+
MASVLASGLAVAAFFGYYWYRGKDGNDPLDGGLIGEGQEPIPTDSPKSSLVVAPPRQNGTADPYGHNGEAVEVSMDNKVEKKHKEEESEEILPDGWTKHVHPESGSTYYFCEATGESSWSYPKGPEEKLPQLPEGWTRHFDSEGTQYYYNSKTGESEWELPSFG